MSAKLVNGIGLCRRIRWGPLGRINVCTEFHRNFSFGRCCSSLDTMLDYNLNILKVFLRLPFFEKKV